LSIRLTCRYPDQSVPTYPQCPHYQQLTTGPALIRFRVRPLTTTPAPPRPMQPTGSTPASAKIRPGCPGGLIPGNRKISRASGCNRSGFFPAGTGMSRKIVLPDAGCSKKFSRAQRDQNKIFPGRILPGKLPGTPARVPRIVPGDLPGEPLPVPPGDPPLIGIPSAHVGSPLLYKGSGWGRR
jgi:hypothetical protein